MYDNMHCLITNHAMSCVVCLLYHLNNVENHYVYFTLPVILRNLHLNSIFFHKKGYDYKMLILDFDYCFEQCT